MKKIVIVLSVLAGVLLGLNLNAQEIRFRFFAHHFCAYSPIDSVHIQNLTQGGDTVLYYPDTVLIFNFNNIDLISGDQTELFLSPNYPNPFKEETEFDLFIPFNENVTLTIYDLRGRMLTRFDKYLDHGVHSFKFSGSSAQTYILELVAGKYHRQIKMQQTVNTGRSQPEIIYSGAPSIALEDDFELKARSLRSGFPYAIGNALKFTAYVHGSSESITDNSTSNHNYFFNIAPNAPPTPGEITGNSTFCEGQTQLVYEVTHIPGNVTYNWTLPPGWEIAEGHNTHSITANVGTEEGEISVQLTNACGSSDVVSKHLTIGYASHAPVEISGETYICPGASTELTVQGGLLGSGATWNWYKGACGYTFVGTGESITVTPDDFTTYFVRAEGDCNDTECAETFISIKELSEPASYITGMSNICLGDETELFPEGGSLGTGAVWVWYVDGCGETYIQHGNQLLVMPEETTTYYLRAEGDCNITTCVSVTVNVSYIPEAPVEIEVIPGEFHVEWHWTEISNANGYKYNTDNDYSSAIDVGLVNSLILEDLYCENQYMLFVWAYNQCGVSPALEMSAETEECPFDCGDPWTYDGYEYQTAQFGNMCWFTENLRYLPQVSGSAQGSDTDPYYYVYGYQGTNVEEAKDSENYETYGVLYNWTAATTACPPGWKLPDHDDWTSLELYICTTGTCQTDFPYDEVTTGWRGSVEGAKLASNEALWIAGNLVNNNFFGQSQFTGLPAGYRFEDLTFQLIGLDASFWTATEYDPENAWYRGLFFNNAAVYRHNNDKEKGYSVRCVREM